MGPCLPQSHRQLPSPVCPPGTAPWTCWPDHHLQRDSAFPPCTQNQQGWDRKCWARSPTPKPGPRKTPCPPGRTVYSGPPAAISPLWSSVPPAQVRARQRAARRASSSLMAATRKAEQSARGRGQALYAPQSRQRAGRAGGRGTGGAPPRSSGKQLGGLRGPAGEILTQVIWGLSFIAPRAGCARDAASSTRFQHTPKAGLRPSCCRTSLGLGVLSEARPSRQRAPRVPTSPIQHPRHSGVQWGPPQGPR